MRDNFCFLALLIVISISNIADSDPSVKKWKQCPIDNIVIGLRAMVDPYDGPSRSRKDDVGITGIAFVCGSGDGSKTNTTTITSDTFGEKQWTRTLYCRKYATGIDVYSMGERSLFDFDDIGVSGIEMKCDDGSRKLIGLEQRLRTQIEYSEGCPKGYAIKSLKTEGMPWRQRRRYSLAFHDNVGLTGVEIKCCKANNCEGNCEPIDYWQPYASYSNPSKLAINIWEKMTSGVSFSQGRSFTTEVKTLHNQNQPSHPVVQIVRSLFQNKLGFSNTTGHNWSTATFESVEKEIKVSVSPKTKLEIERVVGICGNISYSTNNWRFQSYPTG